MYLFSCVLCVFPGESEVKFSQFKYGIDCRRVKGQFFRLISKMLIATPYRDFDIREKSPPRIISEIRKTYANSSLPSFRPKLTGEILVKCGQERCWWPRRASIRSGQLLVSGTARGGDEGPAQLRLPLRHLSLKAGSLPNSLSLCKGINVVLTLQFPNQKAFDEWVKAIAIELIRQTPLDAIKYLDIFTIAECWKRREGAVVEKDWNYNDCTPTIADNKPAIDQCDSCEQRKSPPPTTRSITPAEEAVQVENVKDLMKKCQNVENYVPVKEKLYLFESLCKLGRKVRSTEDVSLRIDTNTKKARSFHDLSNINSHIVVREICKYFENKSEPQENGNESKYVTKKRLVSSDSYMNNVNKFQNGLKT